MSVNRLWAKGTLGVIDVTSITAQERLAVEDVGADIEKADKDIVHLGRKSLFSKAMLEPLRKAESAGRTALYLYSYRFPIGGMRFITNDSIPVMQARLDEVNAEHRAAVNLLRNKFDDYRNQMVALYPDQLKVEDYERTRRLLNSGRCRINLTTFSLDLTNADPQKEATLLDDFTQQAVRDLRETVATSAQNLAKSLADGKSVSERSLNAMRRMVERSKAANFLDDPVVSQSLAVLEEELASRTAKEIRGSEVEALSFRRSLEVIVKQTEDEASIDQVVRGFTGRALDLSDDDCEPGPAPTPIRRDLDLAL